MNMMKNNKKEGFGTMYYKNGDKLETEWNENHIGKKWNILL